MQLRVRASTLTGWSFFHSDMLRSGLHIHFSWFHNYGFTTIEWVGLSFENIEIAGGRMLADAGGRP